MAEQMSVTEAHRLLHNFISSFEAVLELRDAADTVLGAVRDKEAFIRRLDAEIAKRESRLGELGAVESKLTALKREHSEAVSRLPADLRQRQAEINQAAAAHRAALEREHAEAQERLARDLEVVCNTAVAEQKRLDNETAAKRTELKTLDAQLADAKRELDRVRKALAGV